jgi:hypothetical protein
MPFDSLDDIRSFCPDLPEAAATAGTPATDKTLPAEPLLIISNIGHVQRSRA